MKKRFTTNRLRKVLPYDGSLTQSREAMDDAIAFIDEKHPTENELVEYIAKLCS